MYAIRSYYGTHRLHARSGRLFTVAIIFVAEWLLEKVTEVLLYARRQVELGTRTAKLRTIPRTHTGHPAAGGNLHYRRLHLGNEIGEATWLLGTSSQSSGRLRRAWSYGRERGAHHLCTDERARKRRGDHCKRVLRLSLVA